MFLDQFMSELRRRGHTSRLYTSDLTTTRRLRARGQPVQCSHRDALATALHTPYTPSDLAVAAAPYGLDLPRIAASQRARFKRPEGATLRLVYALIRQVEAELDRDRPELVVVFDRHPLDLVYTAVAAERGIPFLFSGGATAIPDHHWWGSYDFQDWLRPEYLEREPSCEERRAAEDYIAHVQRERPVLFRWFYRRRPSERLKNVLVYTLAYLESRRYNPSLYSPWRYVWFNLTFYLHAPRKRPYYQALPDGERFFFLPLHQMEDYGLTYAAQAFGQQHEVAAKVARAMPAGMMLYVKEHPNPMWPIPVPWVREIAALPNVRVLPPGLNAHDIIVRAAGIVTVNSDVGWEALLHGKPVVTLDSSFYSDRGVTLDVRSPAGLGAALERMARGEAAPDRQRVLRLVVMVLKSVHPGIFTTHTNDPARIVDALLAEYSRRLAPTAARA